MSSTTRTATLVLAALAVAIGGFLLLRPGDDEEPASTTPAVTTTAAETAPAATTPAPKPAVARITIKDGEVVGGMRDIEVGKGARVRLTVTSDAPEDIHVHGYDIERSASPGSPARFSFTADIEGRFEVEAHHINAQIAEITVNP